jgi:hypothetical protein
MFRVGAGPCQAARHLARLLCASSRPGTGPVGSALPSPHGTTGRDWSHCRLWPARGLGRPDRLPFAGSARFWVQRAQTPRTRTPNRLRVGALAEKRGQEPMFPRSGPSIVAVVKNHEDRSSGLKLSRIADAGCGEYQLLSCLGEYLRRAMSRAHYKVTRSTSSGNHWLLATDRYRWS